MNPKIILSFVTGIALGGSGVYLMQRNPAPAPEVAAKITQLETALAQKQTELTKLQSEAKSATVADAAEPQTDEAKADAEAAQAKAMQGIKDQQKKMKERVEKRIQAKVDEQLSLLKKRLGLNDSQLESVRALLTEKLTKGDLSLRAMGMMAEDGPEGSHKDTEKEMLAMMLDPMKGEKEADDKLLALLTPEQQAAFAAHKQEQRANKVEMATNKELAKIQGAMSLTPEQKDQIFAQLSQFANAEHDHPIPGMLAMIPQQTSEVERIKKEMGDETGNQLLGMADEIKQRQIRRKEALKPILSEEQMKVYENLQQSSAFDMSDMMGDMGMEMMMMGEDVRMAEDAVNANGK